MESYLNWTNIQSTQEFPKSSGEFRSEFIIFLDPECIQYIGNISYIDMSDKNVHFLNDKKKEIADILRIIMIGIKHFIHY